MQQIPINEELQLTELRESDIPSLVNYLNDKEIYRNTLTIPKAYSKKSAQYFLALDRKISSRHKCPCNWAVRHRDAGLIGGIGRMMLTGRLGHRDEIGYWLAAPFRSRGYMTKVVDQLCSHLFEHTNLVRISAHVYTHNTASARVLEKAHFKLEGQLRQYMKKDGKFYDNWLYARIHEAKP